MLRIISLSTYRYYGTGTLTKCFFYQAIDLLNMTEGKEQHEEEESKTTKKDVVEEKSLDMEAEKEKEEDEHEDDEESSGDDDEASMLVIKNAWRDLADTPAAFPPQLNMDECPPLRGFEGTPHAICRS